MITTIVRNATLTQLLAAVSWTSDNLHIPSEAVTFHVAVAYVCRHFTAGQLSGWDGFVENLEV